MTDGFTCHICAALVDPSAAQVALHMRWHERMEGAITDAAFYVRRPLAGLLAEDAAPALTEAQVYANADELPPFDELIPPEPATVPERVHISQPYEDLDHGRERERNAEMVEEFPDAPDPEPPPPPVERHPQIPEETWAELNADQRLDVAERMDRIASRQRTIDEGRNATDTAAATAYLTGAVADLREEYGIELLPAEELEDADLDVVDRPNPPRACEGMTTGRLQERRRFLLAKRGLPGELEEDRQRELALIASLLAAGTK